MSSRVTKTSVFRGLSLTVIPRFVTWTTDARTRLAAYGFELAIGSPSWTAVQTRPFPWSSAAFDVEAVRLDAVGRAAQLPFGARATRRSLRKSGCSFSSVGIRSPGASGAAHCVTFRKLRA